MLRQMKLIFVTLGLMLALGMAMLTRADVEALVTEAPEVLREATLVVYRSDESVRTRKLSFQVKVGDMKIGRLKSDRAVAITLPAGEHVVTSSMEHSEPLTVSLRGGETVYLTAEPRARGTLIKVSFDQVEERVALNEQPRIEGQI
jgi:hypothetical protein